MSEEIQENEENIDDSKYQKLSAEEHVLHRPTIYIGSTKQQIAHSQVYDATTKKIVEREVEWIPGLLTLFNELINNSYDERVKRQVENHKIQLTKIKVTIDVTKGSFTVWDNGGMPVRMHSEYEEWIPSMLLGSLRSGSNYDDTKRGAVSGLNGVGASLVNVLSKEFILDTADTVNWFRQTWTDNMSKKTQPVIMPKKNWHHTSVTAVIDLARFNIESFTDDIVEKMLMRCIEIAASGCDIKNPLEVEVQIIKSDSTFNETFSFNHFWQFKELYENANKFWGEDNANFKFEVGPSVSGKFESVALLNSIRTDCGTHVDELANHLINHIRWFVNKKHKIDAKPAAIKNQMRIYSWWQISAPDFHSQTKEVLQTNVKDFGFTIALTQKFLRSIEVNEIVQRIVDEQRAKEYIQQQKELSQIDKSTKLKSNKNVLVDKLIDATEKKNRHECIMFMVEGDSAGNGFRKVRDGRIHGLFKLRGKFTNVFYKTAKQLINAVRKAGDEPELVRLMKSLGLQFGEPAATFNEETKEWVLSSNLRYGKICIMTDADVDGYSIACQLVLVFKKFWPELISAGILYRVLTPIIVAYDKKGAQSKFYSLDDFSTWEKSNDSSKFNIQYKKGLGSLSDDDYDDIVNKSVVQQILSTDDKKDWHYLYGWFGDIADHRKTLIAENFEAFESLMIN